MQITDVDPRDQTWEIEDPLYRVYFHDRAGTSAEVEVAGAAIDEVIAFAQRERGDRSFVIYACVPRDGIGLIRLIAAGPTI